MESLAFKAMRLKGSLLVFFHDILMIPIAWFLAYWLRLGFKAFPYEQFVLSTRTTLPILLVIQIVFYRYFGLYRGIWCFASLPDLWRLIKAVVGACITSASIIVLFTHVHGIPRSIVPLYGILLICLLSGSRFLYRYYKERCNLEHYNSKNVLLIGAGSAGEVLLRDLLRSRNHDYKPIGFIDDAIHKQGKEIHGIRVLGTSSDIKNLAKNKGVDFAIIAIPSATAYEMRKIVEYCHEADVKFKTVPSLSELASGKIEINALREVALEDLLGREEIEPDLAKIQKALSGKIVLISGGGGSIGSEICRQIAKLKPKILAIIDNSEFNLYQIHREINGIFPGLKFQAYLGNICDKSFVRKILHDIKPDLVFHAAAYKHVPILEDHIYSAVYNNICGTKILADLAEKEGIRKFILISTDKAVEPANIMGATKRIAEIICQDKSKKSQTQFITVRFGNVLGSSGSVVPLFKKQLADGGPITVTHPEISRYFMTIPEAVHLILQSSVFGKNGDIFVLDMGKPVRIKYLAEQLIRLSGETPEKNVKIVYTGLRPGEKLHEKFFYKDEKVESTKHKKIFKIKPCYKQNDSKKDRQKIVDLLHETKEEKLFAILRQFIYQEIN